jgi:hypothetical protein
MSTPKDLREAINDALVMSLSNPTNKLPDVVEEVLRAVKDRLAQDCQTAELRGETPKQMFDRMFPSDDDGIVSY